MLISSPGLLVLSHRSAKPELPATFRNQDSLLWVVHLKLNFIQQGFKWSRKIFLDSKFFNEITFSRTTCIPVPEEKESNTSEHTTSFQMENVIG